MSYLVPLLIQFCFTSCCLLFLFHVFLVLINVPFFTFQPCFLSFLLQHDLAYFYLLLPVCRSLTLLIFILSSHPLCALTLLFYRRPQQRPESKRVWLNPSALRLSPEKRERCMFAIRKATSRAACLIVPPCLTDVQIFPHTHKHRQKHCDYCHAREI